MFASVNIWVFISLQVFLTENEEKMLQNSFRVPFRILKSRFQFHVSQPCTNWNMFSSVASSTYCCRPLTHHIQRHCRMLSSVIGAAPGTSPTKGIVYSMRPPVDIPEMSLASFMLSKFEKFKNLIAIVSMSVFIIYLLNPAVVKSIFNESFKTKWILLKELAVGSIVYSDTFFKEINTHGSFHVSEDCQHDLLYWPLYLELFQSVFLLCGLFFFFFFFFFFRPICSDKPMLNMSFVNNFFFFFY